MPFSIRLYRRFPVQCSVTYNASPFQGQGTEWNLPVSDKQLSRYPCAKENHSCSLRWTLQNRNTPKFIRCVGITLDNVRSITGGRLWLTVRLAYY